MEQSIPRPPQSDGVAAFLFEALSGISEAAFGVRWAPGTEYGVWMLLTVPRARWGRVRADAPDVAPALATLHVLVWQARVWLTWPDGERAPIVMHLDNWRRVRAQSAIPPVRRVAA
ncbi:hypothetical protein ACFVY4_26845 [Streptomyces sp. NPDC058299]|uniref:hypothetical protein n=1 Tax=Streptomyces sp. NPDC058299 TaxID=3346435 RepID=UPI0036E8C8B0